MGRTQRFGLSTINDPTDGSLSEDGFKYTGRDRRTLDRILAALEQHSHAGGERLDPPAAAPTLDLFEVGGDLVAGQTYYYKVSYVDRYGLETAASPEVSVAMPDQVPIPDVPMLEAISGGSLAEDLYYYALTAVDSDGNETPLGPPNIITVTDRRTVRVTYTDGPPAGAANCKVWRQMSGDSGFTQIGVIDGTAGAQFDDDGSVESDPCPCDPLNMPPDENETRSTNSVRITIPTADVELPTEVQRWRIYRSAQSGTYPTRSLVEEVVDTEDGQLVTEYLDTGGATSGQPLLNSQTLHPSRPLGGGSGSLTEPILLAAPDGAVYRLMVAVSGALVLREAAFDDVLGTLVLTDTADNGWQLGLDEDLALTTEEVASVADLDRPMVMPAGVGPWLPGVASTAMLTVELDGALTTSLLHVDEPMHTQYFRDLHLTDGDLEVRNYLRPWIALPGAVDLSSAVARLAEAADADVHIELQYESGLLSELVIPSGDLETSVELDRVVETRLYIEVTQIGGTDPGAGLAMELHGQQIT